MKDYLLSDLFPGDGKNTGEKIKHFRKLCNITQEELADECGISLSTIRKLESENVLPPFDVLSRIAVKIGMPLELMINEAYKIDDNIVFD